MRYKRRISILLAAVLMLTALPVAGLAAKEDYGPQNPLKLRATSGDYVFQTHYQDDPHDAFELYIEKGKIKDKVLNISVDLKDAKDKLKDVTHIRVKTIGYDYRIKGQGTAASKVYELGEAKQASIELEIDTWFTNHSEGSNYLVIETWTKAPDATAEGEDGHFKDFTLVLHCSVPVTTEVGEHGEVTVGQSKNDIVNAEKSAKTLGSDSKEADNFRIFDIGETVIFCIEPKAGYWPVVEGAEKYDANKDAHKGHTKLVVKPNEHIEYGDAVKDKIAWYLIPNLKIDDVHNVKISFVSVNTRISEIVNVDKISEFDAAGGKIKVKAVGDDVGSKFHLGLFEGDKVDDLVKYLETNINTEETFDVPKNETYEPIEYTVRASLDGRKSWSDAKMTFKVLGIPKKSNAITSIKVEPATIHYHETNLNNIVVTIAGEGLKADDVYYVDVFKDDTPVKSATVKGPNTIAFVLDRNTTDKDITYTIRASMDDRKAYSDAKAEVVVKAKSATITNVTASPTTFDYKGGTVTVSITGENMDNTNSEVALFDGEQQKDMVVITGTSNAALKVPENNTAANKTYTIKVKGPDGVWSDKTATITVTGKPAIIDGWGKDASGHDVYYKDGAIVKSNWVKVGGDWYYMDKDGHKSTGWYKDNSGNTYFSKSNGVMQTGWLWDNNNWFLLADSGKMLVGWQKIGGVWYFMDNTGRMKTGWLSDKGSWYLLAGSGKMMTGWQIVNGKWYYMSQSGAMLTRWFKDVTGKWYYLNHPNGDMVTGTKVIDGRRSRFNNSGAWLGYY